MLKGGEKMEENKKIIITRIFNAPRKIVWNAWTNPEIIKKWWGPEGFTAPSVKIDFKVGGRYIFAMHGPQGSAWDKDMYSAGVFQEIVPQERLVLTDYFSDENGNKTAPTDHGLSQDMPEEMTVIVTFEELQEGKTKLTITYTAENETMYEAMVKSRMEEGWSTSLNKMARVL